jgi:hypothetical protein
MPQPHSTRLAMLLPRSPLQRTLHPSGLTTQRGLTLMSLLFWGVIVAFLATVAIKVLPTVLEYYTVQKVLDRIVTNNPSTVPAVRAEFDRATQIEYSIQSISSKDLLVTKENDKLVISFAYDKQIPVAGPVYLLIKYEGRSR